VLAILGGAPDALWPTQSNFSVGYGSPCCKEQEQEQQNDKIYSCVSCKQTSRELNSNMAYHYHQQVSVELTPAIYDVSSAVFLTK